MRRKFAIIVSAVAALLLLFTVSCGTGGDSPKQEQGSGSAEQKSGEAEAAFEQTEIAKAAEVMSDAAVSDANAAAGGLDTSDGQFSGEPYSGSVNESLASAYEETLPGAALDPSTPMVALTFDDGPYSPVTLRITDLLQKYKAHATFFIVGNRAEEYSDAIRAEVDTGCELANHTWDHEHNLTKVGADTIKQEVQQCNEKLAALTGITPKLLRPVGGAHNETVDASVGMPMIIWSVDTQDWKSRDASSVISRCMSSVKDGSIVLMHDLYPSTAEACETIIPQLVEQGYKLVTVSEMAAARGYTLEPGQAYNSFYQQ